MTSQERTWTAAERMMSLDDGQHVQMEVQLPGHKATRLQTPEATRMYKK